MPLSSDSLVEGRLRAMIAFNERFLDDAARSGRRTYPDLIPAMQALSLFLRLAGRGEEGIPLLRRALAATRGQVGREHLTHHALEVQLAGFLSAAGEAASAFEASSDRV